MDGFTLATLNLYQYAAPGTWWYERDAQGRNTNHPVDHWPAKHAFLAAALDRMDADVIAFQEVFSPQALADWLRPRGYAHVVAGAPVVDPADAALFRAPANAIASRHPFLDCRWVAPRPQIEPDGLLAPGAGFRRAVPEVRIALPGLALPLTVIGVHLKAKGHGADRAAAAAMPDWDGRFRDYLRRRSAGMAGQAIRRAAEAMMLYDRAMAIVAADPAAPVAVMGDFNDDPDSMVMRSLTNNAETGQIALPDPSPEDRRAFFRWQLYDAGRLVFGAARVPTHFSAAHGASVLDTVLVSNALNGSNTRGLARPVAAGVLTDLVAGQPDARRASDHAPVFVRFATRSEAEP